MTRSRGFSQTDWVAYCVYSRRVLPGSRTVAGCRYFIGSRATIGYRVDLGSRNRPGYRILNGSRCGDGLHVSDGSRERNGSNIILPSRPPLVPGRTKPAELLVHAQGMGSASIMVLARTLVIAAILVLARSSDTAGITVRAVSGVTALSRVLAVPLVVRCVTGSREHLGYHTYTPQNIADSLVHALVLVATASWMVRTNTLGSAAPDA